MISQISIKKTAVFTGHNAAIFGLAPAARPGYFLSAAGDGWLVEWSADAPELGKLLAKVDVQLFSMCHLPEAQLIVAGNMNGGVHWVDLADPSATRNVTHHQKGVFAARRLGDAVLTAGGDGVLTRWSVAARRSTESLQLSGKSLRCFDYNPERQELAVGASDGNIYLLSAADFALIQVLQDAHQPSVFSVCYSQDGRTLYSGGRDAHLKSWARNTGGWVLDQVAPAHHFTINDIAIHPGGQVLATASRDKTVKLWRASDLRLLKVIDTVRDQGHLNSVNRLMWLPERKMLLSAGDDRSILGWEVDLF